MIYLDYNQHVIDGLAEAFETSRESIDTLEWRLKPDGFNSAHRVIKKVLVDRMDCYGNRVIGEKIKAANLGIAVGMHIINASKDRDREQSPVLDQFTGRDNGVSILDIARKIYTSRHPELEPLGLAIDDYYLREEVPFDTQEVCALNNITWNGVRFVAAIGDGVASELVASGMDRSNLGIPIKTDL